jgi:NAD(P)-dependent dehydrogenase (short-subunit alcohol dehydrogenase family)
MISLENHVAVVTGASSGIGKAIASGLARKKAALCLVGRSAAELEKLKEDLIQDAPNVAICKADLAREADVNNAAAAVLKAFGRVDILVHSAGFLSLGAVEHGTRESLDLHFKVNFSAPYFLTQALLPALKKTRGQIVFINSSAVQRAIPGLAQYSSAKFALKGLADCLREEINPHGVRVVSIYPGQTATPMQRQLHQEKDKLYQPEQLLQPDDIADVVIHSMTLSRRAELTDIYIRPMVNSIPTA